MPDKTRIALALGSGGARGYAHVGAIQVLEERGYEIVSVAGTSMGALVGGLYAAGRLDEYAEWAGGLSQRDLFRLLDPSLRAPGAIRGEKILARVSDLLAGAVIEDLPIPFTAVATDLLARKEVWFQRGPVDVAIRASIALPGVFTPVMLNGRLLADGGLMNPVPIAPTTSSRADLTVAVSLAGEDDDVGKTPVTTSSEPEPPDEWRDRLRRQAAQVLDRDIVRAVTRRTGVRSATDETEPSAPELLVEEEVEGPTRALFESLPPGLGALDVMELSLDAMQSLVTRFRLAAYPPDLLVTVPKSACRTLDFHKGAEMIALGRRLTEEALDRHPLG